MTDKEVMQMALDALETHAEHYPHMVKGYTVDAVQALRAALAQPEPKPVAFVVYDSESNDIVWAEAGMHLKQNTPLYTAPPQREWQGLTDEEIHVIIRDAPLSIFRAIEAKLKEKNT
jgi:hypothetical protein